MFSSQGVKGGGEVASRKCFATFLVEKRINAVVTVVEKDETGILRTGAKISRAERRISSCVRMTRVFYE